MPARRRLSALTAGLLCLLLAGLLERLLDLGLDGGADVGDRLGEALARGAVDVAGQQPAAAHEQDGQGDHEGAHGGPVPGRRRLSTRRAPRWPV